MCEKNEKKSEQQNNTALKQDNPPSPPTKKIADSNNLCKYVYIPMSFYYTNVEAKSICMFFYINKLQQNVKYKKQPKTNIIDNNSGEFQYK